MAPSFPLAWKLFILCNPDMRQEGAWLGKNNWNKLAHCKPMVLVKILEKIGGTRDSILAIPAGSNSDVGGDLLLLILIVLSTMRVEMKPPKTQNTSGSLGLTEWPKMPLSGCSAVQVSALCELQDLRQYH